MRNPVQLGLLLLTLTAVAVFGYNVYLRETTPPARSYSDFLADLRAGEIVRVHLRGGAITGEDTAGRPFGTYSPDVAALLPQLEEKGVAMSAEAESGSGAMDLLKALLPLVVIFGAWLIFSRRRPDGLGVRAGSGASRFTPVHGERITFKDVAGIAEAKEELQEIVEFLKNPDKYSRLGGRIDRKSVV